MSSLITPHIIRDFYEVDPTGDLLRQMQQFFDELVPQRMEGARQAMREGNLKQLKSRLHSLKNSFLNVGAIQVGDECQKLEDLAANLSTQEIEEKLVDIEVKFGLVQEELKTISANP